MPTVFVIKCKNITRDNQKWVAVARYSSYKNALDNLREREKKVDGKLLYRIERSDPKVTNEEYVDFLREYQDGKYPNKLFGAAFAERFWIYDPELENMQNRVFAAKKIYEKWVI